MFLFYFCSFPLLFAFVVGGLGFEFCVFVAGWRHALRREWPFIIIIITFSTVLLQTAVSLLPHAAHHHHHHMLHETTLFPRLLAPQLAGILTHCYCVLPLTGEL